MLKSWVEGMQVLPSPLEIHEIMKTIRKGEEECLLGGGVDLA